MIISYYDLLHSLHINVIAIEAGLATVSGVVRIVAELSPKDQFTISKERTVSTFILAHVC
jgi:hypothetical protein